MASYNPNNNQGGFQYLNSAVENRGLFSKMLRNLSSWGMNYDDMIMRNQVGVGINEDPYNQKGNSMSRLYTMKACIEKTTKVTTTKTVVLRLSRLFT